MARRKAPHIADELLDQLLSGTDAAAALQQGGLLDDLKKALAERALNAEMDHHLAGEGGAGNSRNGYGKKTVLTDTGKIELEVPRDRQSSFDPQLIAKYQRRFPGFDDKIVSMYARGMSTREIVGLWLEQNEGAKFWLRVMNELKNRGVEDVLIAVVDGLKGFPEAITAVFSETQVQTCLVHLIRSSLAFVAYKDAEAGKAALEAFAASAWGRKYEAIAATWQRNWAAVIPFFAFPDAVRRIIYTTNAIEALNAMLRRAVRARGHFPTDESAIKLLFLVLRQAQKEWKMPPREWGMAKAQFAILFEGRFRPV